MNFHLTIMQLSALTVTYAVQSQQAGLKKENEI